MSASEAYLDLFPEWYRTERETEKTIEKLNNVKELDYYLRNSDEYIRRLAILRLYKTSAKESAYILTEMLDNPVESQENKYLAAWTLKTILNKYDSDIFISSKFINKFTGRERYDELFNIKTEDFSQNIRFQFSSSPSFSAIKLNEEDIVLERDIYFETDFDYKQWLINFLSNAGLNIKKGIWIVPKLAVKLFMLLGKGFKTAYKQLSKIKINYGRTEKSDRIKKTKIKSTKQYARSGKSNQKNSYDNYYSLRGELYKGQNFFTTVKKGVFQLFYILFFPIRFAIKHKLAMLFMLVIAYIFLSFSDYGKALTYKYLGMELNDLQTIAVQKVRYYTNYAANEFNSLTGIDEWKEKKETGAADPDNQMITADVSGSSAKLLTYSVNAKKGLNIRISPDPGAEKVGSEPLPFGSTVIYLSTKKSDANGITWYYVEAIDGRIGWVSSKFLKEKAG